MKYANATGASKSKPATASSADTATARRSQDLAEGYDAQVAARSPANDPRRLINISDAAQRDGCISPYGQFVVDLDFQNTRRDISWIERLPGKVREDIDREYSVEKAARPSKRQKAVIKERANAALKKDPEFKALGRKARRAARKKAHKEAIKAWSTKRAEKAPLEVVVPKSQKGKDKETLVTIPDSGVTRLEGRQVARHNFAAMMTGVFGTPEKVEAHFSGIGPANVPGKPWVAAAVAKDLERASAMFESRYPGHRFASTSVAFSLRNRHHQVHSAGMLGHVLGLSLDYQAYDNPHMKDAEERKLIELVTGGPSHLTFTGKKGEEMRSGTRRKLIAGLRNETAAAQGAIVNEERDPAGRALMQQLDGAYSRMMATSRGMRQSLIDYAEPGTDPIAELQEAGAEYWQRRGTIRSVRKQIRKVDSKLGSARNRSRRSLERKAKRAAGKGKAPEPVTDAMVDATESVQKLIAQKAGLKATLDKLTLDLTEIAQRILAPWINKVSSKVHRHALEAGVDMDSKWDLKHISRTYKQVRYARKKRRSINRVLSNKRNVAMFEGIAPADASRSSQMVAEEALARLNALANLTIFQSLEGKLSGDLDYVFGAKAKTVNNPSMLQLVTRGFLRDDAMEIEETPEGESEAPAKKGKDELKPVFNREFVGVMMENGFDTGAAWSTADSMHFDHVPSFSVFDRTAKYGPEGVRDKD